MRVIKSVVTTDAILTSSNIPEDEYPAWVSGTSYTALDKVIYEHKIYERIVTGSGATTPDLDQVNWLDSGYTNRYRMFDNIISSVSSRTGGIEFTLTPNQVINGIALLICEIHSYWIDKYNGGKEITHDIKKLKEYIKK